METFGNERLKQFVKYLRSSGEVYNNSDFAARIGKNRSYISECMTGRRPVTEFLARDIAKAFPVLNQEWLLNENCGMMLNLLAIKDPQADSKEARLGIVLPSQADLRSLMDTIAKQQAQIDRLLGIIEKMQKQQ